MLYVHHLELYKSCCFYGRSNLSKCPVPILCFIYSFAPQGVSTVTENGVVTSDKTLRLPKCATLLYIPTKRQNHMQNCSCFTADKLGMHYKNQPVNLCTKIFTVHSKSLKQSLGQRRFLNGYSGGMCSYQCSLKS